MFGDRACLCTLIYFSGCFVDLNRLLHARSAKLSWHSLSQLLSSLPSVIDFLANLDLIEHVVAFDHSEVASVPCHVRIGLGYESHGHFTLKTLPHPALLLVGKILAVFQILYEIFLSAPPGPVYVIVIIDVLV